ncbi:MAG: threonine--tRNA ligase [Candidatus Niyogibacteria bacterium RIFCSPLOWO2_01_FULL_45_48]|uniref:Threonine--tRNA ligase n=2 Tax=Candidatus Niyogiibacteriota TaxID=1817912 RepID=A0A1G2EZK6_9BACT|nr:MAG: threonine--tRNA ligase [Candidatus Niyogibacteria bacterium RIFCSPLOWO2_01_FULL_45_48]OGZ29366.1 MAG: threonine--tRNA ligase [Candidatus Niyogibacteria bacterium RIFCSPHIGHO2_01_FULL_45_28]OGZ30718.1 MAG: threonine--tRNA ligase [Candidatus Niyogibacteria bacterium RIFCSPLOWO2_02_FULL_45_13]
MDKRRSELNIEGVRHTLAHVLAEAVLKKFPKAKLGIGPVIESGFYYDFLLLRPLSPDDLKEIEGEMRGIIKRGFKIVGKKVTPAEAKKLFKDQPFKLELVKDFIKEKKQLTVYYTEPGVFYDLCKGGHVKNSSEINPDAFKLNKVAGAYWKGIEKNKMLTRIYGLAFETKKELDSHLTMLAEAEKRDHRRLGRELDLFTQSDLVGAGLPLFTPKGALIREILEDYVGKLNKKYGYQKVWIPHITKPELYKVSGHWEKFKDDLFHVKGGTDEFVLKPMNCPHHTQIYASRPRSYKDLPIKYFETTTVYRNEQSGELGGLTRVRSITQDDGHTFLREGQIEEEISRMLEMQSKILSAVGFNDYWIRLSLRNPKNKKMYLGDDKTWDKAQKIMADILKKKKIEFKSAEGEAAFYGPKMDLMIRDSLGREWQVSTIQLDFNMPYRFSLTYTDENGEKQTPVMIHRAFMGSTERFIGILIEHFAGAFPLWLAPVQVALLSINDKVKEYCLQIIRELHKENLRVWLDDRNETLGKKIREAELQKIPYILVIGEKEKSSGLINVRERGIKEQKTIKLDEFIKNMSLKEKAA